MNTIPSNGNADRSHGDADRSHLDAARSHRDAARTSRFRQAAFVYLHVGILYEVAVLVMWRQGILSDDRGPVWLFLVLGAAILAAVFWGLWSWRNVWFARAIWVLHSFRLPALMEGAFFGGEARSLGESFYLTALIIVIVNLWMLARAGWDL